MRSYKILLQLPPVCLAVSQLAFSPDIQGAPVVHLSHLVEASGAAAFTSEGENHEAQHLSSDLFPPYKKQNRRGTSFGDAATSSASNTATASKDAHFVAEEPSADDSSPGRPTLPKTLVLYMMDTLWVSLPRRDLATSSLTTSNARPLTSSEAREWAEADENMRLNLLQKWRDVQSDSSRRAAWIKHRRFILSKKRKPTKYRPEPDVLAMLQKELIFGARQEGF
ncbi:hypothetical protein TGRUB_261040 [Toxoplasma gondii RUB]|uniref:Transmembrane protein n=10 Tax=Toxoplasma gondii TaxID=5811 RepID=B9PKJ3_TOXGV|nr:hypothetical protein TGGT1_261040 [Toxoplasma gondii GT1]ESS32098.1 hypothetical protein TGVEG_261040 [Toxoplasma gondii VEG]KAF4641138.1 hypothetical protein TGRH88_069470 [Toxoplasma gondii]KFG39723.1 hypothetical protein TGP89_261040 [Toxoplasma gondii p89]KFG49329.1 hypothetical protein TGDOM2_261040 [Toxoplasma gondii GAB2-2007-GAL-DOM2]KFG52784.1 hypothetical protein TGFOU_261040 [Toxoplasma gondii FOU]KFG65375.1 hypothetical protein TGRUB_261040 [Toxoplasma gondii RUB]KFH10625.1 hy